MKKETRTRVGTSNEKTCSFAVTATRPWDVDCLDGPLTNGQTRNGDPVEYPMMYGTMVYLSLKGKYREPFPNTLTKQDRLPR